MPPSPAPIALAITLAKPGGATTFVFRLACWLKAQGEPVVVLVGDEGTWLEERCAEAGIPLQRIPHLRRAINPWHDLQALSAFRKALRALKPRALHLNSSKAGVIGSLAGRLEGVRPIVYCIAGWAALDAISPFQRATYLWPERFSASWKDTIVCLHPGDVSFAERNGIRPRKGFAIIPNGIDLNATRDGLLDRNAARQALGLPKEGFVIGTIANFYPAKDLARFMDTCALVKKQAPGTRFCLIGDGPERAAIETAIQAHHLEKTVILAGAREHADRYLSAFDLFALPSKKEGMPFVLLEAAAAGLPIVTTSVGAHAWMLPEATIVPAQEPRAFAEALLKAIAHPQRPSYDASLARFQEAACLKAHADLLKKQGEE